MTKQEILNALEALKDFVNHEGQQAIDGIKAGVLELRESAAITEVPPGIPKEEEPDMKKEKEVAEEEEEAWSPANKPEKQKPVKNKPSKSKSKPIHSRR